LKGKARAVLESVEDPMNLNYADLKSKLELRFGEGYLSQNFYASFTSRKQKEKILLRLDLILKGFAV